MEEKQQDRDVIQLYWKQPIHTDKQTWDWTTWNAVVAMATGKNNHLWLTGAGVKSIKK